MAILDEDAFARLLKTETQTHIWCIFGDDAYLKEYYRDKLISQTVDDSLKFFNFHVYEDETDLENVFADAENLPMMAQKTCLLIKDHPLNQLGSTQLKAFEKRLADVPESSVLIFFFGRLPVTYDQKTNTKWNAVIDLFAKYGAAVNLSHRTRRKTVQMLIKGAAARGVTLSPDEAEYLIDRAGEDTMTLRSELDKVCAYAEGQAVTKEMIDRTVIKTVEASVFEVSEALFAGNADRAFETATELLRQKTSLQAILGALSGAYVNIYRLKTAREAGKTADDFAESFGYNKKTYAYAFRKISAFAKKSSMEQITKSLDILLDADVKSKSSVVNAGTLLTEVLSSLAALAG
ncbi:MAG: DNA polymerase III subunit delta [Clostridia bacterium]|nr:DNA polymerase III subunit delta [Clostridia bacterium]